MAKKNILITGPPGVGKTTLIQQVIAELNLTAGGFYTKEIREDGRRVGFEINALTPDLPKSRGVLARIGLESPHRVSRYGVNLKDMEEVGAAALEEALRRSNLIIIDEIGNMEMISQRFREAVIACLDGPMPVLGVIKAAPGPFVDRIKARSDGEIIELTRDNFARVKQTIKGKLTRTNFTE